MPLNGDVRRRCAEHQDSVPRAGEQKRKRQPTTQLHQARHTAAPKPIKKRGRRRSPADCGHQAMSSRKKNRRRNKLVVKEANLPILGAEGGHRTDVSRLRPRSQHETVQEASCSSCAREISSRPLASHSPRPVSAARRPPESLPAAANDDRRIPSGRGRPLKPSWGGADRNRRSSPQRDEGDGTSDPSVAAIRGIESVEPCTGAQRKAGESRTSTTSHRRADRHTHLKQGPLMHAAPTRP